MRLIDADAVKEALRNRISENIDECINNVPTVDVLEQIRDEIAVLPEDMGNIIDIQTGEIIGKYISSIKVLQIIDRHMKGDTE